MTFLKSVWLLELQNRFIFPVGDEEATKRGSDLLKFTQQIAKGNKTGASTQPRPGHSCCRLKRLGRCEEDAG